MKEFEEVDVIEPFTIPASTPLITDLQRRLKSARWADAVVDDWSQGTQRSFLHRLASYWSTEYNWVARRDALDLLPHFIATIDGYGLHFLHFKSASCDAIPLLLMNGWPSSFVEFRKLVPLLVNGAPSFHVVIPTLPGFGFSSPLERPYQVEPHDIFPKLMTRLGYDRFVLAGTDIGAGVATRIALYHPERCLAVHVSSIPNTPSVGTGDHLAAEDRQYLADQAAWYREEGGYHAIQVTRPQTLAFALADSPIGLASWIVEKYRAWSDCSGDVESVWEMSDLLDNIMVYWQTNTVASSLRYYYDAARLRPALAPDAYVGVPTAIAVWPHDLVRPPLCAAKRLFDVRRYSQFAAGGHFPAWEQPEAYARDIRAITALAVPGVS